MAPLLQAATFLVALRRLGVAAATRPVLRLWSRSFLLRYEPSGVVGFAYRMRERERLPASAPQMLTATGYEQLAAVTAGALAAVAGGMRPPLLALGLLGGTLVLAGAFALAWLVGVLVPLAPGGLGLRDGVFVLTSGVTLGLGPATALAVALRVASLAGELLAVAALEGRCGCSPTRSPPTAPGLHVLHRAGKGGLGVAYRAGFREDNSGPRRSTAPGAWNAGTRSSARWTATCRTRPRSWARCSPSCVTATPTS